MASLFAARRKPRRVISTPQEDDNDNDNSTGVQDPVPPQVVRRPLTKPKSKLRASFGPGTTSLDDDSASDTPSTVNKPKPKPSRLGVDRLPRPAVDRADSDRPTYSKSYLDELKGSTPSTPKDLSTYASSAEAEDEPSLSLSLPAQTQALNIASKYGSLATSQISTSTSIPTPSEIAEKRERRARLAKESSAAALTSSQPRGGSVKANDDYIPLEAYDSDGEFKPSRLQVSTYLHNDEREAHAQEHTRLIPEDEDIAEGFDNFVDDDFQPHNNRINMGNLNLKGTSERERKAMREMIADAEGISDDGSNASDRSGESNSDSDASRNAAYQQTQTSHGTAFSHLTAQQRRQARRDAYRPRQPEKTVPIPTLAAGLGRLRELREQAELKRGVSERRVSEIERRVREVEGEKERIQAALEELGMELDGVRKAAEARNGTDRGQSARERGLESIGSVL